MSNILLFISIKNRFSKFNVLLYLNKQIESNKITIIYKHIVNMIHRL